MWMSSVIFSIVIFHAIFYIKTSEAGPAAVVNPSQINLGVTSSLDVNCSFVIDSGSNVAGLISLIVSRSNNYGQTFTELASLTEFKPSTVTLMTSESFQANGFLDQVGQSYLHLRWTNPSVTQAGLYQCSALAIDAMGHNMDMVDSAQVSVHTSDVSDLAEKLKEAENATLQCQNRLSLMETYTAHVQNEVAALTCILNKKFDDSHLSYNTHTYYLSLDTFTDVDAALQSCTTCGGYLTEIDDAQEHQAIRNFLGGFSDFNYVSIAGSDRITDDVWLFQSTNQSLPYVSWGPSYPRTGSNSDDCIYLYSGFQWKMWDHFCHLSSSDTRYRFLCEMPYAWA